MEKCLHESTFPPVHVQRKLAILEALVYNQLPDNVAGHNLTRTLGAQGVVQPDEGKLVLQTTQANSHPRISAEEGKTLSLSKSSTNQETSVPETLAILKALESDGLENTPATHQLLEKIGLDTYVRTSPQGQLVLKESMEGTTERHPTTGCYRFLEGSLSPIYHSPPIVKEDSPVVEEAIQDHTFFQTAPSVQAVLRNNGIVQPVGKYVSEERDRRSEKAWKEREKRIKEEGPSLYAGPSYEMSNGQLRAAKPFELMAKPLDVVFKAIGPKPDHRHARSWEEAKKFGW